LENYNPNNFERGIIQITGKIKRVISIFLYKSIKNEVYNLRSFRPGSYISLNDVIRYRVSNFTGSDPEPLVEYWISPKDYETENAQKNFDKQLKIIYRCKINYVAKNKVEQNVAFVVGTATVLDGIIRTREPRALLIPFYYMARIVSGFYH